MADDALVTLTATEAAAELASGAISAEEYSRACLARIDALDGDMQTVVRHELDDGRTKTARKSMFFQSDEVPMIARQLQQHRFIERAYETHVHHRRKRFTALG